MEHLVPSRHLAVQHSKRLSGDAPAAVQIESSLILPQNTVVLERTSAGPVYTFNSDQTCANESGFDGGGEKAEGQGSP
jgi:hypothetical protein